MCPPTNWKSTMFFFSPLWSTDTICKYNKMRGLCWFPDLPQVTLKWKNATVLQSWLPAFDSFTLNKAYNVPTMKTHESANAYDIGNINQSLSTSQCQRNDAHKEDYSEITPEEHLY